MWKVLADVGAQPDATGMPGAAFIQTLLNWLSQVALWGSLGSLLAGAAVYGISQHTGNYAGGFRGKQLAVAGASRRRARRRGPYRDQPPLPRGRRLTCRPIPVPRDE